MFLCWVWFGLLGPASGTSAVLDALAKGGDVQLPAGTFEIHAEVAIPRSVRSLTGHVQGTTLRAGADFSGRALLVAVDTRDLRIARVAFDGNLEANEQRTGFPPSNQTFAQFTRANGVLVLNSTGIALDALRFKNVAGYAILASRSTQLTVRRISVSDSGSRNAAGRNNGTGGILVEDGTANFTIEDSRFLRIRGNAVWTHSRLDAARNGPGEIRRNSFDTIGRDAIQVGHATSVQVHHNVGTRIGYPTDTVDTDGGGIPVAIDTAGNVDLSAYNDNQFTELNGKCIDLDGFHHGEIARNVCTNRLAAAAYPSGHYAVVFNNNNPQMRSEEVRVHHNTFSGMKYGGVFLLGERHQITHNRFLDINRAGCPESHAKYGCLYFPGQPDLLSAGIYLGVSAAEWSRQEPSRANQITDNVITGHGMSKRCVAAAPAVEKGTNIILRNTCREVSKK